MNTWMHEALQNFLPVCITRPISHAGLRTAGRHPAGRSGVRKDVYPAEA